MNDLRRLILLFGHWNPMVRYEAIETALVRARGEELITVCEALEDERSFAIRPTIEESLGAIRDPGAIEPLCALLASPNVSIRRGTLKALIAMRDPRIVDALSARLFDAREDVVSWTADTLSSLQASGEEYEKALRCAIEYWETRSWPVTQRLRRLLEELLPPPSDLPIPTIAPVGAADSLPVPAVGLSTNSADLPRTAK